MAVARVTKIIGSPPKSWQDVVDLRAARHIEHFRPERSQLVTKAVVISVLFTLVASVAWAEPLGVKAVMSPKEQISGDLPTREPHEVQATFVPGPDGKARLLDNGVWRFVGGTGGLDGIKGAGILHIKAVSPSDREFELTGEAVAAKK